VLQQASFSEPVYLTQTRWRDTAKLSRHLSYLWSLSKHI